MNIIRLYNDNNNNKNNNIIQKAYLYKSPIGNLFLYTDISNKYLIRLDFKNSLYLNNNQNKKNKKTIKIIKDEIDNPSIIKKTKKEIEEYFLKKRKIFDIPIALYGTNFQYSVWLETSKIPFGEVLTYSDIAKKVSNRFGSIARAVGLAEGKNPISIIIPCHRVVGKNNKLTGYGGGIEKKEYLLKHEGFNIKNLKLISE